MSRIQYRDLDVVLTIEQSELAAVYGAGLFKSIGNFVKNNWKSIAKTVFSIVPVNKNGSLLGGNYSFSANSSGVSFGWSKGSMGFNFGFGF